MALHQCYRELEEIDILKQRDKEGTALQLQINQI